MLNAHFARVLIAFDTFGFEDNLSKASSYSSVSTTDQSTAKLLSFVFFCEDFSAIISLFYELATCFLIFGSLTSTLPRPSALIGHGKIKKSYNPHRHFIIRLTIVDYSFIIELRLIRQRLF